ncbi:MAG: helix-turn-helix domain-containing protein [Planctomycetota bacterium]
MLDIGQQIKRLREERRITGKDLASQIGLSQSQMSRLEAGQRRIDTEILARIASALDVSPALFFGSDTAEDADAVQASDLSAKREKELELSQLHAELGKMIRSERRRRHLTMEDLARKTGHTRAYVAAVEEGRRNGLEGGFLKKALKLLAIDPLDVIEAEERIVRDLKTRVHQLDQQLAIRGETLTAGAAARIAPADEEDGDNTEQFLGTPILVGDESIYPAEFDDKGHLVAAVEGFLTFPDLAGRPTFAVRVQGDTMAGPGRDSFAEGDLVVFATDRSARSGELAFVRFGDDRTEFRQIFHDDHQVIRLQALRPEVPPILLDIDQVHSAWPLVTQVHPTS